jgi:hypothetical protein
MNTTASETCKAYRVIGSTNDVTTCEYCGRDELKGTVILAVLDADGNTESTVYFGTGCAATAGRRTVKEISEDVKLADRVRREAELATIEESHRKFCAARDEWLTANFGPDALSSPRKYGFRSPFAMVKAFEDATGIRA